MIVIVDYGIGNLGSVFNMFRRLGIPAKISADAEEIAHADRLVLPGVGAFDSGREALDRSGLVDTLNQRVLRDGIPVMGICLGMQLMTCRSEEGQRLGLGWIDAQTVHFASRTQSQSDLKLPHVGWNYVYAHRDSALLLDLPTDPRFYFVHSYRVECTCQDDVLLRTRYGEVVFTAAFQAGNIIGVQFHPEKSHQYGMRLLANFAAWQPRTALE